VKIPRDVNASDLIRVAIKAVRAAKGVLVESSKKTRPTVAKKPGSHSSVTPRSAAVDPEK
jgi:hypothetical protein